MRCRGLLLLMYGSLVVCDVLTGCFLFESSNFSLFALSSLDILLRDCFYNITASNLASYSACRCLYYFSLDSFKL